MTSQVGRRWFSSCLLCLCVSSDMTSKLSMNIITTPSSFFTGTTSTIHRKHWPARRDTWIRVNQTIFTVLYPRPLTIQQCKTGIKPLQQVNLSCFNDYLYNKLVQKQCALWAVTGPPMHPLTMTVRKHKEWLHSCTFTQCFHSLIIKCALNQLTQCLPYEARHVR